MIDNIFGKIPVVIMAGGLGKRVASIDNTIPKPLIKIGNKPVLQWEIECLVSQGYNNIILTVNYMADKIQAYFGDGDMYNAHITYFVEEQPLGNAGALFKLWESGDLHGDFFLLNADSMFDIDLDRFYSFHVSHDAQVSLFVHPNNHPYDSGLIIMDNENRVIKWLTKDDHRPQYYRNSVNAGLHILNTSILSSVDINPALVGMTDNDGGVIKVDLDRQILKPMCGKNGRIFAYSSPEYVKDMGTPDRFEQVKFDFVSGLVHNRNLSGLQKAIFLDRDGTLNKYAGFLNSIEEFELIDGVAEAIRRINQSGYLAIVVTNQPVIARGEMTFDQLNEIHNKMETLLGECGAYIDGLYICPHHPDKGFDGEVSDLKFDCDCRKPKPGLLLKATQEFNISLKDSYMIGDSWRDVAAGQNAGCKTVLLYGEGTEGSQRDNSALDLTGLTSTLRFPNLLEAVKAIL